MKLKRGNAMGYNAMITRPMPCCGSTAEIGKVVHIDGGQHNVDGIRVLCHICGKLHITNDVSHTIMGHVIPTSRLKTLPLIDSHLDPKITPVMAKYLRQKDQALKNLKRR